MIDQEHLVQQEEQFTTTTTNNSTRNKKFRIAMMAIGSMVIVLTNCAVIAFLVMLLWGTSATDGFPTTTSYTTNPQESSDGIQTDETTLGLSSNTQEEESTFESTNSVETTKSITNPSTQNPTFQCPNGMFRCTITRKSNSIYPQPTEPSYPNAIPQLIRLTKPNPLTNNRIHYICIDNSRLCDGVRDCPGGEDEDTESVCPKPTQPSPPPQPPSSEGCYLCKDTHDQCISMSLLCNRQPDCPLADDEHVSFCSTKLVNSITSRLSNFTANQYAPTNISIVNNVSHREFSEDDQPQDQNYRKREIPSESNWRNLVPAQPETDSNGSSSSIHNGVGFMFRVDNMVVYNSQVKMFNQNSENVAPTSSQSDEGEKRRQSYSSQHGSERVKSNDLYRSAYQSG